ncbi:MAG: serine/threonine protein kinase, partial [Deltaproteobacteria bacterium CG17_big_fil_post_rev_8_21_14_2_50_63_7]
RRLFVGGSDLDVMLRVRDVDVDEELRTAVALPKDLDAIVRKALTRDPASRYQSAIDLH